MSRSSFLVLLMVVLSGFPAGGSIASAQGDIAGAEIDIRLSNGRTVALTPFRIDGKQGFLDVQCGIVIERRRFTVIGAGDLEVYTCRRLVAAGSVPPIDGKVRIGLIYDVASPSARCSCDHQVR
ncbi:exported hypothetical protein [Mesorhizobium metallidurans STM 2683]|uniref:Uncharacterized protein n=1 Tax=Mesorhizobium metallidurans STM 2683 TaxID=1297569 RepID=M5EZ73_9HYPH|nr:hypothetical protein [Mesorhizobium metallidurans]CCV09492.1 exported hypothetical protein [Mesorhizobium metallidurans STM 2683]